jgi:hypothetical protein
MREKERESERDCPSKLFSESLGNYLHSSVHVLLV